MAVSGIVQTNFWTHKIVYSRPYYAQAYMQDTNANRDRTTYSSRQSISREKSFIVASGCGTCGVEPVGCEMAPVSCEVSPVSCDVSCASCNCGV